MAKSYPTKQDAYRKALKEGAFGAPEKPKDAVLGIKPDKNGYIAVDQSYATDAEGGEGVLKVAPKKVGADAPDKADEGDKAKTDENKTSTTSTAKK